jgi:hypothetical protein
MLTTKQHADDGADGRSRGGQADGPAAFSFAGQGIAVQGRGRGGGGAGNVDQDGGVGSAVGAAHIDGQQAHHGQRGVHAVGQGGQQGHAQGGCQSRHGAEDDAQQHRSEQDGQVDGVEAR